MYCANLEIIPKCAVLQIKNIFRDPIYICIYAYEYNMYLHTYTHIGAHQMPIAHIAN